MRHSVRRFGPVLLWQLGTLLLWLGALAIGAGMSFDGPLLENFGTLLGVLMLFAVPVSYRGSAGVC